MILKIAQPQGVKQTVKTGIRCCAGLHICSTRSSATVDKVHISYILTTIHATTFGFHAISEIGAVCPPCTNTSSSEVPNPTRFRSQMHTFSSSPPLANTPALNGLHSKQWIAALCPNSECSGRVVFRESHSATVASEEAVANKNRSIGLNAMRLTDRLCACS